MIITTTIFFGFLRLFCTFLDFAILSLYTLLLYYTLLSVLWCNTTSKVTAVASFCITFTFTVIVQCLSLTGGALTIAPGASFTTYPGPVICCFYL